MTRLPSVGQFALVRRWLRTQLTFRTDRVLTPYNRRLIVLIGLSMLLSPSSLQAVGYTLEDIAQGMTAAEAQFTNLQMQYTLESPEVDEHRQITNIERHVVSYARSSEGQKELIDWQKLAVKPGSTDGVEVTHKRISFNGTATTLLDYDIMKQSKGKFKNYYRAFVRPGRVEDAKNPVRRGLIMHDAIWAGWGGQQPWPKTLLYPGCKFRIEGEEAVDGIKAVKLSGMTYDEKVAIELWVSPERNFLPVRSRWTRVEDKWVMEDRVLTDIVQLGNGLWYPKGVISRYPDMPSDVARVFSAKQILTDPIPDAVFNPVLPAPTLVHDEALNATYVVDLGSNTSPTSRSATESEMQEEVLAELVKAAQGQAAGSRDVRSASSQATVKARGSEFQVAEASSLYAWLAVPMVLLAIAVFVVGFLILRRLRSR